MKHRILTLLIAVLVTLGLSVTPASAASSSLRVVGSYTISIACSNPGTVHHVAPGTTYICPTQVIYHRTPAGYDTLYRKPGTSYWAVLEYSTGWHACDCLGLDIQLWRES